MYTNLLAASFLIATNLSIAQSSADLEKGDKHYDQFDFQEALYFYEIANEQLPNSPAIMRRIADTHRKMGDLALSTEWYRRTLETDSSNAEDMIHYAEALKCIKEYEAAVEWYEKYSEFKPSDKRAQSHIKDKFYFEDLLLDSLKYKMKKLRINNPDPTIGICFFENEKFLVSAVKLDAASTNAGMKEPLPYLDIYACDYTSEKELTAPIRLPSEVNSKYHDGPAYYHFKDRTLYITRNNIRNGKPVRDKNGSVNLKIYSSKYDGSLWTNAQELKFNSDEYSNGHPCLSKDGNTMYFVSNRPKGYGGTDIYMCTKLGGTWGEPSNLGATVNTEGDEMFPFLADDGRLFYASNGHAGLGGLDVFVATKKAGVWSRPKNMGFPVNSNQDDFSLVYDSEGENGFFCSNRDGQNNDELFAFNLIQLEKMIIAGTIRSTLPQISLANERIKIHSINTGITVEKILDSNESFSYEANAGDKIEVQLINAEYFDTDSSLFTFEVPTPINDPYVNLGDAKADFKKLPPTGTGILSDLINKHPEGGSKGMLAEMMAKQGIKPTTKSDNEETNKNDDGTINKNDNGTINKNDNGTKNENDHGTKNENDHGTKNENDHGTKNENADKEEKERKNSPTSQNNSNGNSNKLGSEEMFTGDLASVQFDFDKTYIREDAKVILNAVSTRMINEPGSVLKIDAHCDSRGRKVYNEELSQKRASNVKKYLVKRGVKTSQIKIGWHGEKLLKNQCDDHAKCTEIEHSVNRRAELSIVSERLSSTN
jgi:outer membrane protein OmpA-like peptidoglycan-associated protein/tetratricopeptide (TPR) repeat protein